MLSQYGSGAVPSYTPSDLRIMKVARRIAEYAWRQATPAERETLEVKPLTRRHFLGVKITTPDERAMLEAAYAEHLRNLRFGRITLRTTGGKRRKAKTGGGAREGSKRWLIEAIRDLRARSGSMRGMQNRQRLQAAIADRQDELAALERRGKRKPRRAKAAGKASRIGAIVKDINRLTK